MVSYSDTDRSKGLANKLWLHLPPPRQISTLQFTVALEGGASHLRRNFEIWGLM
jgi:hypothetical protein